MSTLLMALRSSLTTSYIAGPPRRDTLNNRGFLKVMPQHLAHASANLGWIDRI